MDAPPEKPYRMIDTLTGLRAYAALWALSRHFFFGPDYDVGIATRIDLGIAFPFAVMGSRAIDIFFVLSGFVIPYVYHKRFAQGVSLTELGRYYAVRLGRIYPVHLAIILIMAAGYGVGLLPVGKVPLDWPGFVVNVALVQCWGFYDALVWNRPAWTVSAEWFVYLLFPLFFVVFTRIRRVRPLLIAIAVLSLTYYAARWGVGDFPRGNLGLGSLMRASFGFLLGLLMHNLYREGFLEDINWDAVCMVAIATLLILPTISVAGYDFEIIYHLPICVLVYSLTHARGYAARIFDNRPITYLGEISYSFYLVHFPLLNFLTYNFGPSVRELTADAGQAVLWMCALGLVAVLTAVSSACYQLIELPCREYIKRSTSG